MRRDRSHLVARRLVAIMFGHVARHFAAGDFEVTALTDEIADAVDDEFTEITRQVLRDLSPPHHSPSNNGRQS